MTELTDDAKQVVEEVHAAIELMKRSIPEVEAERITRWIGVLMMTVGDQKCEIDRLRGENLQLRAALALFMPAERINNPRFQDNR